MSDMGLLGLAAFLLVLIGALWMLLQRLRTEHDPLAAVLIACWVMMNAHGLMEINCSIQAFQCLAFFALAFAGGAVCKAAGTGNCGQVG